MQEVFHGRIHSHGRLVIPAELRHSLRLDDDTHVVFTRDGDAVRITTFAAGLREAQDLAAQCFGPGTNLQTDLKKLRAEQDGSLE